MNELLAGIGQRISSARKSKKMTQEALAELANVSYQTISSAELGKKALRPENIIKISQALQVSTDYLLTGNRNTSDYITLDSKLATVDSAKYDRIMRVVDRNLTAWTGKNIPGSRLFL